MPKKPVLLLSRRFTREVEQRIDREFESRYNPFDRPFSQKELLTAAQGADALLVSPGDELDALFFELLPNSVKVIATFSVGCDHIDAVAAKNRGIPIANTPGVLTDAAADLTLLLILGASRRAHEGQELVRSGAWSRSKPRDFLGIQLTGKVLGIYGMGRIGQAVAKRATAFGMRIHYCNRSELPKGLVDGAIYHSDPEELLRASAFLSLHAPGTQATRHFLNSRTLALLPRGAVVINTSRGSLVKDQDLIAALKCGHIAAAGLDVFEGEPQVNAGYLGLSNVFLLPHLGSATEETRTAMGMLALDNITAVLSNSPAPTLLFS
jgi:lactate dehydrogenase-like 2-hydroxyacid dehydrogenase